jgi:hypothetical protein
MEESDLWRLAAMLVHQHGDGAETYACLRADEALENHNIRACDTWKRVAAAITDLENQTPPIRRVQ